MWLKGLTDARDYLLAITRHLLMYRAAPSSAALAAFMSSSRTFAIAALLATYARSECTLRQPCHACLAHTLASRSILH